MDTQGLMLILVLSWLYLCGQFLDAFGVAYTLRSGYATIMQDLIKAFDII